MKWNTQKSKKKKIFTFNELWEWMYFYCLFPGSSFFHPFFILVNWLCMYGGDTHLLSIPIQKFSAKRVVVRSKGCVKLLFYYRKNSRKHRTHTIEYGCLVRSSNKTISNMNISMCISFALHNSIQEESILMPNIFNKILECCVRVVIVQMGMFLVVCFDTFKKCPILFSRLKCENWFWANIYHNSKYADSTMKCRANAVSWSAKAFLKYFRSSVIACATSR